MNAYQLDANGVIINMIVVDSLDVFPNLVDTSIGGRIGDSIVNGILIPKTISISDYNAPILEQLNEIDAKSIRALREGDTVRIAAFESQAVALRLQLRKV